MVAGFQAHGAYREIDLRMKRAREEANLVGAVNTDAADALANGPNAAGHPISLGAQTKILMARGISLAWRDPQVLRFQAIQNIVFGIILGSLYSSLGNSQSKAYALSMAMVVILGMVCMVTVALNTAVAFADKLVFEREQSDSLYSPVSHFFARLMVGLPISCIVAACLILPAYWWIGLRPGAPAFFFFFAVNLAMIFLFDGLVGCTVFVANDITSAFGLGNFYEAIAILYVYHVLHPNLVRTNVLSSMSGIFIPYTVMPPYWSWLFWITPFSYAYAAIAVNEFLDSENEFWLSVMGIAWYSQWGKPYGGCHHGRALALAWAFPRHAREQKEDWEHETQVRRYRGEHLTLLLESIMFIL